MKRRLAVVVVALLSGLAVSAGLLVGIAPPAKQAGYVIVSRDVPAGAPLGGGVLELRRGPLTADLLATAASPAAIGEAAKMYATHQLISGQLLQRADLTRTLGAGTRLVYLPLSGLPPVAAGQRVDLLLAVTAGSDTGVTPFAQGVLVTRVEATGLVLAVSPEAAPAFVYASLNEHLVALGEAEGSASEPSVQTLSQALAGAGS
ncbi:MAG TPA: hypothetical protein VNI34_03290 [Candidatus Nitrosotalea sp.]|nr:hypothetical protein [Candidatus Nitrosotalea sp.]